MTPSPALASFRSTAPLASGVGLVLMLLAGCAADANHPPMTHSGAHGTDTVVAINALIDGWHDAAARGDFDRYFAAMTPDAVFLGTDASERWVGQEFRDFARPYFKGPTDYGQGAWTYKPLSRHVHLAPAPCRSRAARSGAEGFGLAWFDELLVHDTYGRCRGTGVLIREEDEDWRIAHYSLTFLVPNDIARDLTGTIRAFEAQPP